METTDGTSVRAGLGVFGGISWGADRRSTSADMCLRVVVGRLGGNHFEMFLLVQIWKIESIERGISRKSF